MRPFALCFTQRVPHRSFLRAVRIGSCRIIAWPLVVIFLLLSVSGPTVAGQNQSKAESQNSLQIVHPIETVADLQRELDQLQAESKKLDGLIAAVGNGIYIQTDRAVSSAGGTATATLGALFVNQSDYKEIRKTAAEAGTAAKNANTALEQARAAYQRYLHSTGPEASKQMGQAAMKAAEASDSLLKFETKSKDVYSQTKNVFDRLIAEGRVATGTATPKQAKELAAELAKRFWDTRPEFAQAAKALAQLGHAREEEDVLIQMKHSIRTRIAELTDLRIKQASAPEPLRAAARDTSEQSHHPGPSSTKAMGLASEAKSDSNEVARPLHAAQVAAQKPEIKSAPPQPLSSIPVFDPSKLPASERAAWQRNQDIIARETLGRSASASIGTSPRTADGPPASDSSVSSDPSTLSQAGRAAWERNQAIIARETLRLESGSMKNSRLSPQDSSTTTLSPADQAPQHRNPAIVTAETLDRPTQALAAQGELSELDAAVQLQDWRDKGNRAFRNPEEQRAFYQAHPELQKYNSIAEWRSPMTEVDRDLNNGSLSIQSKPTSMLTPAEQARKRNEQIVAKETLKPPSMLKTASDGVVTYDISPLTPTEQAARKRNEQIVAKETLKPPSTLITAPDGVATYDPTPLTSAEQAARKRNEQIVAKETLKPPSTLITAPDGVTTYDPTPLTSAEQAARKRNEQIVAGETLSDPQQAAWDWVKTTFPELEGTDGGLSFGDMSTHFGPNGLKAVPSISACLELSCPKRYFDKDWTVMLGSKMVAKGFGDVQFLSGDLFLANPKGGGPYKIYSTATGKSVSDTLVFGIQQANYMGNGYFRIVGLNGNIQWFQVSQSPSGVAVSSVPSPLPVTMAVNSAGQCLLQVGLSAFMNNGVAKAPVWGPCFSSQSKSGPQKQQAMASSGPATQTTWVKTASAQVLQAQPADQKAGQPVQGSAKITNAGAARETHQAVSTAQLSPIPSRASSSRKVSRTQYKKPANIPNSVLAAATAGPRRPPARTIQHAIRAAKTSSTSSANNLAVGKPKPVLDSRSIERWNSGTAVPMHASTVHESHEANRSRPNVAQTPPIQHMIQTSSAQIPRIHQQASQVHTDQIPRVRTHQLSSPTLTYEAPAQVHIYQPPKRLRIIEPVQTYRIVTPTTTYQQMPSVHTYQIPEVRTYQIPEVRTLPWSSPTSPYEPPAQVHTYQPLEILRTVEPAQTYRGITPSTTYQPVPGVQTYQLPQVQPYQMNPQVMNPQVRTNVVPTPGQPSTPAPQAQAPQPTRPAPPPPKYTPPPPVYKPPVFHR